MSIKAKCSHCQLEYDKQVLKKVILQDIQHLAQSNLWQTSSNENPKELYFCCNGCESVYMLLAQNGLSGFYERLSGRTLSPVDLVDSLQSSTTSSTVLAKSNKRSDISRFRYLDELHFLDKHTKKVLPKHIKKNIEQSKEANQEYLEVNLIIEGIHCAACVWLNEVMLAKQDGVIQASINYTSNKAKIVFNPHIIKLSSIFALIASIGYEAHIYDPKAQENLLNKQNRAYFVSFVVGVFCTMSIMMVAIAQYAGYFKGMSEDMKSVLNVISCLLATPVLFYTGRVFFIGAYYGLKQGFIGMDFLVAFGASLTFAYSVYASFFGVGEPYFESVAMIVLFVFSGKFLEIRAKSLASDSLDKLQNILPSAVLAESSNGNTTLKDSKELKIGDIIHIREGEILPCDGTMLAQGSIDTRSLSGESEPVLKQCGEEVLSGSIALDSFRYKVAKTYADSTMSNIIKLLEESLESKPNIQNLANSLSKHFSRVVLLIALCGFVYWWHYAGVQQALIIAISVIVISCPCALALATPIASVVGISRGFRQGVLFKQAKFLETLARCEAVLFDKTGTLTEGKLAVKKECKLDSSVDIEFAKIVLADFLQHFSHPISLAVADFVKNASNVASGTLDNNITLKEAKQTKQRGIYGIYEDKNGEQITLLGGSLEYLQLQGIDTTQAQTIAKNYPQMSIFAYAIKSTHNPMIDSTKHNNGNVCLLFFLQDSIKNGAKELISHLQQCGKKISLISGDRQCVVESIAKELGLQDYRGGLLPSDKLDIVKSRKNAVMIGDGLNDILALQNAEVGIAMGGGYSIAIAQSDVVVLDDSLEGISRAFKIAKDTYSRIKQNLAISLVYNALLIPLALCGFVIPLVAALSMSLSSLLVVGNSLRK